MNATRHIRLVLAALLSLVVMLTPSIATADPGSEEVLPRTPTPKPSVPNFGTTTRADGTPIAVVVTSGLGGKLNVIELKPGGTTTALDFADESIDVQAWSFATLPDRSLLIGSWRELFRYEPDGNKVTRLSQEGQPGWKEADRRRFETIWDIAVDESGTAYLAASVKGDGGARILTWRADKGWGSLPGGDPVSSSQYAQSIDYADGHVYVGTGPKNPQVIRVNTTTGAKQVLPVLPSRASGTHIHLEVHGGWLYTNKPEQYGGVAYNLATGAVRDLGGYGQHVVVRPGDPRNVYFVHNGKESGKSLFSYDPTTGTRTLVLNHSSLRTRLSPLSWATPDIFVSNEMTTGEVSHADLRSGTVTLQSDFLAVSGRQIQAMTSASNGKLYASWFMTSDGVLEVTPGATAGETTYRMAERPVAQAESMASDGEWLASGQYPNGTVRIESLRDPKNVTTLGIGYRQDRPYVTVPLGGGDFAFGSVPTYGNLGGAISIYERSTGKLEVYPLLASRTYAPGVNGSLVANLSPISMARKGNTLYVGTTTRGGHGMSADTEEAYILEFDLTKGNRKVTRITKVLDQQVAVTGLTVGSDGVLYGITGTHVFRYVDGRIEAQKDDIGRSEQNRSWLLERGGRLYGVIGGRLVSYVAKDFSGRQVLAEPGPGNTWVTGLTLGTDGRLYYAKGATLYRQSV